MFLCFGIFNFWFEIKKFMRVLLVIVLYKNIRVSIKRLERDVFCYLDNVVKVYKVNIEVFIK